MQNLKFIYLIIFVAFLTSNCTTNDGYLYKIFKDGTYGFIDSTGTVIIKPQYIMAIGFSEGLALAVIDTSIISTEQKSLDFFSNLPIIRRDTIIEFKYGYINIKNKMVIDSVLTYRSKYSKFSNSFFNQYIFDLGKLQFSDGLALFNDKTTKNYGFINKKGDVVVKPIYKNANSFSDGLAAVCVFDSLNHNDKWGFIDVKGNIIIQPKYNNAIDFNNGLAFVFLNGTDAIKSFKNNPDGTIPLNFYWMLINKSGKLIGRPLNAVFSTPSTFSDSISIVQSRILYDMGGFKFMDGNGNYTSDFDIEKVTAYNNGFAGVKSKDGWLFVDKKMIIKSGCYENVLSFSEGYAAVKVDGMWGYIDTTFKKVIDCRFDTCSYFYKGLAKVQMKSQSLVVEGFINKKGNVVWQNEYYDNN